MSSTLDKKAQELANLIKNQKSPMLETSGVNDAGGGTGAAITEQDLQALHDKLDATAKELSELSNRINELRQATDSGLEKVYDSAITMWNNLL